MKYFYVVLGSDWDLYKTSYADVSQYSNGIYVDGLSSLYGKKLGKLFNSVIIRINKIPFGYLFLTPLFRKLKKIKNPICFVLFGNWVEYDFSLKFLEKAKKLFPNAKFVWFMQDLVDTHPRIRTKINDITRKFDLVLSFDYSDCKRYNLTYHPLVFSSVKLNQENIPYSDVYFLGKAKNRLPEIIKTYEFFKSKDLKVDFYLVGVPKEKQLYPEEIHYIDGMSYMENLRHISGCKCALEIMQKGGTGYTQRVSEILYFNTKIITNNQYLKKAPFYDEENMLVIDDLFNINESFISHIKDSKLIDYQYSEKLSPLRLLEFIDSKLV